MRRRLKSVGAGILVVAVTAGLVNTTGLVRLPGGPLRLMGVLESGAHLRTGLPVGHPIYLTAPKPVGGIELTIERIAVQGASPGVRIRHAFVVTSQAETPLPDPGSWLGRPAAGRLAEPPASISLRDCCEPQDAFVIEFELDDPGPHTIAGLSIDYRSGLFEYRTVFDLEDPSPQDLSPV
jgi:hypothetical protein